MLKGTLAAVALAVSSATSQAATFTFTAGTADSFAAPSEVASPSVALSAAISLFAEGPGTQDFDLTAGINAGGADRQVAHTFTGLPVAITAATLTLRVRAGSDSFTFTDGIALSFVNTGATDYQAEVAAVYSRAFGSNPGSGSSLLFSSTDPGLLQQTPWVTDDDREFTLDLAALPLAAGGFLDLLASLNSNGFLDVNVSDDTAVDFLRLDLTTASPIPLPAAFYPLLAGLTLLAAGIKRRAS